MNKKEYAQYLRSPHWIEFRKSIVAKRNRCQQCWKKEWLHVHHRNYTCIRHETSEDVIVLCWECHFRFHSKKKWKKVYYEWWNLDFTYAKNTEDSLYKRSGEIRECRRCWGAHPLCYVLFKNWQKALAIMCNNSRPRTEFLKYEVLDIPTYNSRSLNKIIGL